MTRVVAGIVTVLFVDIEHLFNVLFTFTLCRNVLVRLLKKKIPPVVGSIASGRAEAIALARRPSEKGLTGRKRTTNRASSLCGRPAHE